MWTMQKARKNFKWHRKEQENKYLLKRKSSKAAILNTIQIKWFHSLTKYAMYGLKMPVKFEPIAPIDKPVWRKHVGYISDPWR